MPWLICSLGLEERSDVEFQQAGAVLAVKPGERGAGQDGQEHGQVPVRPGAARQGSGATKSTTMGSLSVPEVAIRWNLARSHIS